MSKPHYCRKCPTRPKAHHWMFKPQGSDDPYAAECKYCGKMRKFTHKGYYDPSTAPEIHSKALLTQSGGKVL